MKNEEKIGKYEARSTKHEARSMKLEERKSMNKVDGFKIENSAVQHIKQLGLATQTINPVFDELANMACRF